jgi:DNA-directed RNA polymerase specialized sigma24 family protein
MRYRPPELRARFKAFKSGDDDALEEILQSEKTRLFDYIMRMTGQLSRSWDATNETINVVMPVADHEESLEDLLVVLYKTARNFSLDIWNAETSRLENGSYGTSIGGKVDKTVTMLLALEHIVRSLPPKQREVLILHERLGFSPDEIADITSYPIGDVEEIFAQALGVTEAALTGDAEKVPEFMTKLHAFQIPEAEEQVTQNLSMVFKDLKKSSKSSPGGVFKLFMGLILVMMMGIGVTHYESLMQMLSRFFNP